MHRLWNTIIEPIFNNIKPKKIIEIGSNYGINTKNIINYCHENNGFLVTIDSNPKFNLEQLKKEYPNLFNFMKNDNLNSLKSLNNYDLILIDDDPNWYTVYNELKIIEKKFNENEFPIILLHNIGWPYGKRDLYYYPENIPKEYLNPYEKLGIIPNKNDLTKNGMNNNLNNTIYENTPKNGVYTAVEDFLKETKIKLKFKKINAYHGLGILYQEKNISTRDLNKILLKSDICGILEKEYLNKILIKNSENKELKKIYDENKAQIEKLTNIINQLSEETEEQQNFIQNLTKHENILRNSNKKILLEKNELTKQTKEQQNQITKLTKQTKEQQNQITKLTKQTKEQQNQITQFYKIKENLLNRINKLEETEKRNIILTKTKIEQNKIIKNQKYELENMNNDKIILKKENVKIKSELKESEKKNKKQNQLLKKMKIKDK